MGRNLKLLISIFSLTVVYGLYYWGVPAFINIKDKTEFIEQKIFEETGFKVSIKNPNLKMGYIPSVWVSADNISVLNDDNSKAFSIQKPNINIRLLPLIIKNIDIRHFSADSSTINLVFDKSSKLRLGQYLILEPQKSDFKINRLHFDLGDYNINLDDQLQNKKISLNGQYLQIKDFRNNKHIDLNTDVVLNTGSKKSFIKTNINLKLPINKISDDQLEISGHIANLDLSDFSIYAKTLSKGEIKSLSGIVNLTAKTSETSDKHKKVELETYINNLGIFKEDLLSSIYSKDKVEIKSDFSTINNGIQINGVKINSDGIHANLSGNITHLNAKLPVLDLKIGVKDSKAEKILPILPGEENLSPDINILLLKQTGFWGDANGELEIKGKADYPKVYGKILVTNAYMVKPIPNAKKATIGLDFTGNKFNLDVTVPTSPDQTVWVKGPINIDENKHADLKITSTKNVDLKTAQIVLNPLHEILHFELGPVPIMDIKGKGGIDLHVVGTTEAPHAWGQFYFNNGNVSFLDIKNMELTNASGTLDFNDENTLFQNKTGLLNGKPIFVKGTCSLEGVLNFDVDAKGQDLKNLLKIAQSSPMLKDIQDLIKPIENASGNSNFKLNLTGQITDPNNIVFNKNIFAKGSLELLSDVIKLKELPTALSKTTGNINFENFDASFNLSSYLNKSNLLVNGSLKDNKTNLKVVSNKFNLGDGISALALKVPYSKDLATINSSFEAKYNGKIDEIDYNKLDVKGKIYSNSGAKSSIIVNNSNFELDNSNFKLPLLNGTFKNSPYNITINASKIFSSKPIINGNGKIKSFALNTIQDKEIIKILPKNITKQISDFDFGDSKINLSSRIVNNNINAFSELNNINILYKPKNLNLTINNGNLLLKNNSLNLNKITAKLGKMPIFINGKVLDFKNNPNLNLYVNAKPTQEFFDEFINQKSIYPVKLKGDAILTSNVNGNLNNINAKSTLQIAENSSLYYMGASLGDIENPVKIYMDCNYLKDKLHINNLQYDKIISSQNNKPYIVTQLNSSGTISFLSDNNIAFNNFKIKTQNPTDAKIFNIIFRKPLMKQGIFTSDLVLNGTSLNPKIFGKLNITSIDIPFFDSTIRDMNLNFTKDKVYALCKGVVLNNNITINATLKNNFVAPYIIENLNFKLADLDINKITSMLIDMEAEATQNQVIFKNSNNVQSFNLSQLIIQKAQVEADKIRVRNINANNFVSTFSLNNKMLFNVDKFKFDIAQGSVLGSLKYNLLTHKIDLDTHLNSANADVMSEALFDLKGQIYGSVNGDFKLSCNGTNQSTCFKTINGNGNFKIANGKMPKLGSLEYLLKAGNLFKGGFTGLSINSLIDLITPLKTGEFESISGSIKLKDGIANQINVYSSGSDLNMYMTGSYNLTTSIANMEILGSLSKNITTVFGKIKNASLSSLLNTIPVINNSNEQLLLQEDVAKIPNIKNSTDIFRIFAVDINGDINGNNYVRSFKWVK